MFSARRLKTGLPTMGVIRTGPLLLRCVVFLTGTAALGSALPGDFQVPAAWGVVAVPALLPAFRPGSWPVAGLELTAVLVWILRTTAFSEPVTLTPLIVLAAALYLHHVASALAAALPFSAVVTAGVWAGPAARAAAVLVATAVTAAAALGVAGRLEPATAAAVPVVGVVLALTLVALLVAPALRSGPSARRGD